MRDQAAIATPTRWVLTPRARRVVLPVLAVALIASVLAFSRARMLASGDAGPFVGQDLHAVSMLGDRLFVGGHGGAAFHTESGGWT